MNTFENACVNLALKGGILSLKRTLNVKGNKRYYVNNTRVSKNCYSYLDILCKQQSCFYCYVHKQTGTDFTTKLVSIR